MNSSSNDLPDVAALLKELECSPAWQELKAAHAATVPDADSSNNQVNPVLPAASNAMDVLVHQPVSRDGASSSSAVSVPSVDDLLSQLNATITSADPLPSTSNNSNFGHYDYGQSSSVVPPPGIQSQHYFPPNVTLADDSESRQLCQLTFRQSLPVLSDLGEHPTFVASIKKMKADQDQLERKLWADREAIHTKYQEKLKMAQTKAQMIGSAVSQHEITMLSDAFKKEIYKFDDERVLPAWDGLISRQQGDLAQKGVPTMFVTSDVQDREVRLPLYYICINIFLLSNLL
ncbi:hypothetical protein HYPSUDRAFT_38689 [Hypholoma sublateritium FD-334 SS-4]|uniref:Uncharacterized protein n=1 Tax=Hypholoma sublateritium (strain FD-334 SS-4) TaxID=945553 RepID=A0A0D2P7K6_HYPSF|nr:hypothetical protein HYPSUDRAFT_38689 [Hypholoma sublateritium FD-334 SS-4]